MSSSGHHLGRLLAAVATAALIGCSSPDVGFERGRVEIATQAGETVALDVEVADTAETRAVGLTGRDSLAPDSGMVLLHDEPTVVEVWMRDTAISLSAAWFDESGRIVWIEDLDPCESDPCVRFSAPDPVIGVLEGNQDAFGRWGVSVGDTLEVVRPIP